MIGGCEGVDLPLDACKSLLLQFSELLISDFSESNRRSINFLVIVIIFFSEKVDGVSNRIAIFALINVAPALISEC